MDILTLKEARKMIHKYQSHIQKIEVDGYSLKFTFDDDTEDTMTFESPESALGLYLDEDGDVAQEDD